MNSEYSAVEKVLTSAIGEAFLNEEEEGETTSSLVDAATVLEEPKEEKSIEEGGEPSTSTRAPTDREIVNVTPVVALNEPRVKVQEGNDATSPLSEGWGGMLSVLGSIKSKASSGLDRLYDALDPALPENAQTPSTCTGEEKSAKQILEKLSPQQSPRGTNGGWFMETFDRTFDRASDTIGSALIGGLKKLESTVGIAIEPVSSPTSSRPSSPHSKVTAATVADENKATSTPTRESHTRESSVDDGAGESIYSSGLAALGVLGRKTAGLVSTTKNRLTPILRQSFSGIDGSSLQRTDLKKLFVDLFDELSGNVALEKLQVRSAEASVDVKGRLKSLPPKQVMAIQAKIKPAGSQLDSLREAEFDSALLEFLPVFDSEQRELLHRLLLSIDRSLDHFKDPEAGIEELRARVESPLPVDISTLYLYLVRSNLANILSAALHILLTLQFPPPNEKEGEEEVCKVVERLYGAVSASQKLIEASLVDSMRRSVISKLVADDCATARSIFGDAALTLQPSLRLAAFINLMK